MVRNRMFTFCFFFTTGNDILVSYYNIYRLNVVEQIRGTVAIEICSVLINNIFV